MNAPLLTRMVFGLLIACLFSPLASAETPVRERLLLDQPWRFALGHTYDRARDFNHATGYFSYLAKTGFGDGAANPRFDDRAWREVSIPHDWAVEMPFDASASPSHGYKALGPGFPQSSIGWYRHSFFIPEQDLGRKIRLEFDGIQRAARVFVNGFFVGEENLGNIGQSYDITAYLNYGGDNVIAVRADVSIEAGWYYEGAGINRPVYLLKTDPIHVDRHGTFVTTQISGKRADVSIETTLVNQHENTATAATPDAQIRTQQTIVDAEGNTIARVFGRKTALATGARLTQKDQLKVANPRLWSLEDPYLYTLITRVEDNSGRLLDEYHTRFGIRSIRFDANKGFFLNGKHVKLKGSNNHEDHAGVGTATPDALLAYRLQRLKDMGMNAYRASHAPLSPSLLALADSMGMLVIDETRIAGINDYHLKAVEEMIKRGRNHPSIILWSLGNEEWAIEGNIKGARIAQTMQDFARRLDPTRLNTFAISGGWGGVSTTIGAMGVNYIKHGDTDQQHRDFPWQIILGTEETTTQQTRGIYVEDKARAHLPPKEEGSSGGNGEIGWRHYAERDYLAGVFYWTGFDYRGEPTPYQFPAVATQFGILDSCGFAKDSYYYLQSWWTDKPVLHIFPHWDWPGREGETIEVRAHSNADEVELFLNDRSLGKQTMARNGHLAWQVEYQPGELTAQAYRQGKAAEKTQVRTSTKATKLALVAHQNALQADGKDVAVINVSLQDASGQVLPKAENLLHLAITGPGKIIGVGNGNPSSHEDDVQVPSVSQIAIGTWQAPNPADNKTPVSFSANFDRPSLPANGTITLLLNALGEGQTVSLNGVALYSDASPQDARRALTIDPTNLKATGNSLHISATPHKEWRDRESLLQYQPASFAISTPAAPYQRKLFNGWAQVIVQSTGEPGNIRLQVASDGLPNASLDIPSH